MVTKMNDISWAIEKRLQRSPLGWGCELLWHMAMIKSPALIIFIPGFYNLVPRAFLRRGEEGEKWRRKALGTRLPGLPPTFLQKLINLKFMSGLLLQPIFFWKKSIESGISSIQNLDKFSWLSLTSCFTKRGEHLGENYSITRNFQRKYHS